MQERRTEADQLTASAGSPPVSSTRQFFARHANGLAVLAVLVISLASAAWFTRSFYYFQDDFIFIHQAQTSSLSVTYLRGSLFQHFSPVSRLLDYVLAHWFHSSVAAAHTIELVLLAASVLAFSWTISELVGRHWWRHLLTLAFAESLALIHLLGGGLRPPTSCPRPLFGLLTIAGVPPIPACRVTDDGSVLSILSYGLSLCTHEQSWLVVGYLILFDLLVLAPGGRVRAALVRMWREAWIWLGYALLTVLAMVNYFAFYYAPLKPRATIVELIRYIGIQFSQEFAPSAIGLRPLTTGWTNTAALVLDSIVFAAIVIVSIYRRPSAWRVWTVFGVGFLANAIMIGANRVGYFGVDFGLQLYYLQSPAYLFLLCVGAAFSLDTSGAPYARQQEDPAGPRIPAHHRRPSPTPPRLGHRSLCSGGRSVCARLFQQRHDHEQQRSVERRECNRADLFHQAAGADRRRKRTGRAGGRARQNRADWRRRSGLRTPRTAFPTRCPCSDRMSQSTNSVRRRSPSLPTDRWCQCGSTGPRACRSDFRSPTWSQAPVRNRPPITARRESGAVRPAPGLVERSTSGWCRRSTHQTRLAARRIDLLVRCTTDRLDPERWRDHAGRNDRSGDLEHQPRLRSALVAADVRHRGIVRCDGWTACVHLVDRRRYVLGVLMWRFSPRPVRCRDSALGGRDNPGDLVVTQDWRGPAIGP